MDAKEAVVTVSWEAEHYESGSQVVELGDLPRLAPVVEVGLTEPPPVSITLVRLPGLATGVPA